MIAKTLDKWFDQNGHFTSKKAALILVLGMLRPYLFGLICICNYTVQKFGVSNMYNYKLINTSILQGHIKLIKGDSKSLLSFPQKY